jgi:hypothetical protein
MTDWMKYGLTLLGVVLLFGGGPAQATDEKKGLPEGWFITESAPQLYEAGVDTQAPCEGTRSAYLRSRPGVAGGYGTFMQAFGANAFRGKRLRFSASVRTEDVKGWSGLWMRVEGQDPKEPLAFDNMQSRALVGTTPCRRYEVVLDVPPEAKAVMAGLLLSGTGSAWIGAVRFEPVDDSVPETNLLSEQPLAAGPTGAMPPRSDVPTGRVGEVWFNQTQVEAPIYRALLQPDGTWKDNFTASLSVTGNTVHGTLDQRDISVTVKTEGSTTLIEGTWGEEPLRIELGPDKLTMKRRIYERNLVRDTERPAYDRSCVRYFKGEGALQEDQLDVCGVALGKKPPPVQLVLSFLRNGFRPVPPSHVKGPVPPVRSDPRYSRGE